MLRAILFDFNGILVDDEPIHFELFREVLAPLGIELGADDYYSRLVGYDDRGVFEILLAEAGGDDEAELVRRLIDDKAEAYEDRIRRQGWPFFPGAAELVADVAASDLELGVVSGALRAEIEGALGELAVRRHFKCLVAAEDVAASKPDPEGYRQGLRLLSTLAPVPAPPLEARQVLAIEDTPAGLAAAAGAGLRTLGVAHTCGADELAAAERVVPSLRGLDGDRLRAWFDRQII